MTEYSDFNYLLQRKDPEDAESEIWNWTTIPTFMLEPDEIEEAYIITYSYMGSQSDIPYHGITGIGIPQLILDYYQHLAAPSGDLEDAIEYVLSPNEYSVSFVDVAPIIFDPHPVGRGMIDIGSSDTASGFPTQTITSTDLTETDDPDYHPNRHGDIFFHKNLQTDITDKSLHTILHEFGHALGLKHNFEGQPNYPFTQQYTVMSYTVMPGMEATSSVEAFQPTGLQLLDIAALQEIYGRNYLTRSDEDPLVLSGNTTYKEGQGFGATTTTAFMYTIWDGGGIDVIDARNYADAKLHIDLRQGSFSSIGPSNNPDYNIDLLTNPDGRGQGLADNNLAIAYYAVIENVIGDGEDVLIGNAWDNVLYGMQDADEIYGDGFSYDGDAGFHEDDEDRPGPDAADNDSGNDVLLGGSGDDTLYGGRGNDVLHGGFDKGELDGARADWDAADQFNSFSNVSHASDGSDIADYSKLQESGIKAYHSATQAAVYKGTFSGGLWSEGTDQLFSIEKVIGTDLIDEFVGGNGGNLTLAGGAGLDLYAFALSNSSEFMIDNGEVFIDDTDGGILTITDEDDQNIGISAVTSIVGGVKYIEYYFDHFHGGLSDQLFVTMNMDAMATTGISRIIIDGTVYNALHLSQWIETNGINGFFWFYDEELRDAGFIEEGTAGADSLNGGVGADELIGGTGNDVYAINHVSDTIIENVSEGTDVANASVSYTLDDNVENLILTGSSDINGTGNASANTITGNSGNNIISGGGGVDTLIGGSGNDTYVVDSDDIVSEGSGGGADTLQADFSITLGSFANIENLSLTGSANLNLTGDSNVNILTGNSGNNTLSGGAGADTMIGSTGDDVYLVDNAGDVVSENTSGGTDLVSTGSTYTLGANVENLILTGTSNVNGTGNAADNYIIGNGNSNTLTGLDGNDTLEGVGGLNRLIGGTGDDTYIVDFNDSITESSGAGNDSVFSVVSFTLTTNVENLTLTGTANINATGNSAVNVLTGNSGDNTLSGNAGADTLIGGAGNDAYQVETSGDILIELASQGVDTVYAAVDWTLGSHFENLTLTSAYAGTGNSANNILLGNVYSNTLDGGAGSDTMTGGAGDDLFIVDDIGDVISEGASEGTDRVESSVSFTLGNNVEKLLLTGSSDLNGFGNAGDNTITGNSGNNTLDAGTGTDTLIGGAGDDVYVSDGGVDVYIEASGEGFDVLLTSGSIGMSSFGNIESVTLTGTADIFVLGSSSAEILTGNSGNNSLIGNGGADTMIGGLGDDIYGVDNAGDIVSENASEGTDTVRSSISYTLGANLENLELTSSGTVNGTGNSGNNTLTGNSAVNTLTGGAGDDVYIVSNAGAIIVENTAEGTDTVQVGATFTLTANLENLLLTGSSTINGTGNSLANTIVGNSNYNTLSGGDGDDTLDGGVGADMLLGGNGNDLYIVDNTSDVILNTSETAGTDSVQSSVTYSLSTLGNVEHLSLTGSNAVNATGNSLDNILRGDLNSAVNTLTGGAGNDTYYIGTGDLDIVVEAASSGTDTVYSERTSYTLTTNVENLTLLGSGDYDGTGSTGNNLLTGNSGNNSLDGNTGTDTLIGGAGDDTYVINVTADIVSEDASAGNDTVIANITGYTLTGNVENIILGGTVLAGTGNSGDNTLTGNASANTLTGAGGNDTLDGSTGNDKLLGGTGDDVYIIDSVSDTVTENASEGTDTVRASVTFTIATNVENLVLTGSSALNGTGNGGDNTLTGNDGINSLDGAAGTDTLAGGLGNDTYTVDSTGDAILESASAGTDTVRSSVSYTLSSTEEIENLVLTGTTINGTGNALANTITGSSSVNVLSGLNGDDLLDGGAGADTLIGGAGDDTFIVDNTSDLVSEASAEGTDTVQSSVTFTLGSYLENLTLTASANIHGTGNTLDNTITATTGANTLTGLGGNDTLDGGAGNDVMIGGTGDDVYFLSATADVVSENAAEGTDTVYIGVTGYTLDDNAEILALTGSGSINGFGNSGDNTLIGNSGSNTLQAYAGNDTYILAAGNDTINETVSGSGTDTLYLTGGYTINDLTLAGGQHLVISYGSSQITISNQQYTGANNANWDIEFIRFDDGFLTTLSDSDFWTFGTAGADTLTGGSSHDVIIAKDGNDILDGEGGDDDVHGGIGNDTLSGGAGTDLLHGGAGTDLLSGGDGLDTLFGGAGADTFNFENANAWNNVDVIRDFNLSDSDVLDLGDLLSSYNPLSHTLTDFVKIEDSAGNSVVSVDRDGTGGTYSWAQIATLNGVTGLTDESALVTSGNLLIS
jgi:Ca2+-binding RTX toxin-like protein